MKKIVFKHQLNIAFAIICIGVELNYLLKQNVFTYIGWIINGLLFYINPAFPSRWEGVPKMRLYTRLAGFVVIILGLSALFSVLA